VSTTRGQDSHLLITTTHGALEESTLFRSVIVEDRPTEIVVLVRWQLPTRPAPEHQPAAQYGEIVRNEAYTLPKDTGVRSPAGVVEVFTIHGLQPASAIARTVELTDTENEIVVAVLWRKDDEVVRRDAHVILKRPSVEAAGIAAALA
jgi:hypothetical protein